MRLNFKSTKFHIAMTCLWVLLMIPTFLWLKESILWVAFMSCYALAVGHLSSYEAAASAGVDDETHRKLNALADGVADLMQVVAGLLPNDTQGRQAATKLQSDASELRHVVGIEQDIDSEKP